MDRIKKNFGFGFMRLPMLGDDIDIPQTCRMVDEFLGAGFNYFDVAHGYMLGRCEQALRECLTSRHERSEYVLADKLTGAYFSSREDIRPFFMGQLESCGVEYFDFYLMHAQDADKFEHFKACRAYETAFELKAEGRIRHVGVSFHDKPEVLEQILSEYPMLEFVQIQFNYADYDDPMVESRKCYEVCRRHGKPVIVMEPVKGGSLADLPAEAAAVFEELRGGSCASYALRFAASFPSVMMVLSGMSSLEQLRDNISSMREFKPLDEREREAVRRVQEIFRGLSLIPCTACRYCLEGCPRHIKIPDIFSVLNSSRIYPSWNAKFHYNLHISEGSRASDCVQCGCCEDVCPQHLKIRELLKLAAAEYDAK